MQSVIVRMLAKYKHRYKPNMRKIIILLLSVLALSVPSIAQCPEPMENKAFKSGESLVYDLYYNWKFIWVKAGSATMTTYSTRYAGQQAFRTNLITRGNSRADKFWVMRDTLMSYVTENMVPLYFRKGAREGERYTVDEVSYSYPQNGTVRLAQSYRNRHGEVKKTTRSSKAPVYDMISMLNRARSFDASNYRKGTKIKFLMADGDEVETQTIIYRGKEKFKSNSGVTYRCLVLSFVEYEDGDEKEIITFYVTDDKNHLPVRLDLNLKFGSAKAFLCTVRGNRHPLTSIVKK